MLLEVQAAGVVKVAVGEGESKCGSGNGVDDGWI